MPLKFTLKETLEREGLTKYAVSKEANVRPNTLTDLYNGDTRSLRVDTIDSVINAINRLTGQRYGLEAIMIYEDAD